MMPKRDVPTMKSEARDTTGLLVYLQQGWQTALNLVFPLGCAGCGRADTAWCAGCDAELQATPLVLIERAWLGGVPGSVAATGAHVGDLQTAVQALKYDQVRALAAPLGGRMAHALALLGWSPEVVIPVPLHRTRHSERGYNQARLLAEAVAWQAGLTCMPEALLRTRSTRSQVGLNHDERVLNVQNAFIADSSQVYGKVVLIVDDVYTTGATLSVCAAAVLAAGGSQVYGLTVTAAG
ncbi:MAG: ComF family protein [Armatimonadetes bacterium]|nr:ComF family protein [Anaerolineae bacterium]